MERVLYNMQKNHDSVDTLFNLIRRITTVLQSRDVLSNDYESDVATLNLFEAFTADMKEIVERAALGEFSPRIFQFLNFEDFMKNITTLIGDAGHELLPKTLSEFLKAPCRLRRGGTNEAFIVLRLPVALHGKFLQLHRLELDLPFSAGRDLLAVVSNPKIFLGEAFGEFSIIDDIKDCIQYSGRFFCVKNTGLLKKVQEILPIPVGERDEDDPKEFHADFCLLALFHNRMDAILRYCDLRFVRPRVRFARLEDGSHAAFVPDEKTPVKIECKGGSITVPGRKNRLMLLGRAPSRQCRIEIGDHYVLSPPATTVLRANTQLYQFNVSEETKERFVQKEVMAEDLVELQDIIKKGLKEREDLDVGSLRHAIMVSKWHKTNEFSFSIFGMAILGAAYAVFGILNYWCGSTIRKKLGCPASSPTGNGGFGGGATTNMPQDFGLSPPLAPLGGLPGGAPPSAQKKVKSDTLLCCSSFSATSPKKKNTEDPGEEIFL